MTTGKDSVCLYSLVYRKYYIVCVSLYSMELTNEQEDLVNDLYLEDLKGGNEDENTRSNRKEITE